MTPYGPAPTPATPPAPPMSTWPTTPPTAPPLGAPPAPGLLPTTGPIWGQPPGGPGSSPTPNPRPSPRRPALIVTAVVLALALLAVTFLAGTRIGQNNVTADQAAAPAPSTTPSTRASRPSTTEQQGSSTDPTDPTTPPDPTDPANPGSAAGGTIDPAQLDAAVTKIEAFVEQDRGHAFKTKVRVQVMAKAAFQKRVLDEFDASADAMRKQGDLLKAFGLIPADLDVVASQRQLLGDGVLGFYDPKTKELVVGGDHIGPFLREVMAHELTHALDDQWFNLDRPELDHATDGSDWAYLALVEGSAKRVENDYVKQMSDADQQALEEEQLQLGLDQMNAMLSTPMVLARIQMMPYDYGEPFVRGLVERHGLPGLDDAMSRPPTTSEQVLDGTKYDAQEGAVPVDRPAADGTTEDDGVLGELLTGLVLHNATDDGLGGIAGGLGQLGTGGEDGTIGGLDEKALQDLLDKIMNGEIDPAQLDQILGGLGGSGGGTSGGGLGSSSFGPVQTVKGWGGDHFVLWTSAAQGACVRVDWKMDTPAALATMTSELHTWASTDPKVTIDQPTPDAVQATRCSGPTGSTPSPAPSPTTPTAPDAPEPTTPAPTASTIPTIPA